MIFTLWGHDGRVPYERLEEEGNVVRFYMPQKMATLSITHVECDGVKFEMHGFRGFSASELRMTVQGGDVLTTIWVGPDRPW